MELFGRDETIMSLESRPYDPVLVVGGARTGFLSVTPPCVEEPLPVPNWSWAKGRCETCAGLRDA